MYMHVYIIRIINMLYVGIICFECVYHRYVWLKCTINMFCVHMINMFGMSV